MRRLLLWLLVFSIISSTAVFAQGVTCDDPDEQPDMEDTIDSVATVKYGLTDKTDECVSGRDGYHKDPSSWVREYYCAEITLAEGGKTVKRNYEDIDCTRHGYEKCEGGRCVGGTTAGGTTTRPRTPEQPRCGDKRIDSNRGEQCDPPDDICYIGDDIGICTRPTKEGFGGCQCKLYDAGAAAEPETPPANATPPVQAPPVQEQPPAAETPPVEEQPPETSTEPVVEEREPLPTEEMDSKGIGITRAITNGVKKFFRWIGSWF